MRLIHFPLFLIIVGLLVSCTDENYSLDSSLFKLHDGDALDINFSNDLSPKVGLNILEYLYYYNGGGVAIGDINQDGLEDIYFTANQKPDKLFLNKGDLHFEDISESAGISKSLGWSTGVSIDDVNGDGLLDIYVCKVDPITPEKNYNELYINQGKGIFVEQAATYGLDFSGYSTQASFFDYDEDGDLDMYLLNHSVHSVKSYGEISKRNLIDTLSGDKLFENKLNESEKSFIDVTLNSGIYSSPLGYGLAIITADINQDGFVDIYVGNDFHENDYLYINNGDKTFTESMSKFTNHGTKFTMGVDVADMNQDGMSDIFTTDMLPYDAAIALKSGGEDTEQIFDIRKDFGFEDQYARNHFQLQNDNNSFTDIALMTNTYASDWSWSALLQDFDNNGLNDIFITNGIVKRPNDLDYINYLNKQEVIIRQSIVPQKQLDDLLKIMPVQKLKNLLFLQSADLEFSDLSQSFVGDAGFSNGAAYADLDQDGDLDLVINNINEIATILENTSSRNQNYVSFSLSDPDNIATKNAKINVYHSGKCSSIEKITTKGYQSSSSHYAHFGLADIAKLDSVIVVWPDDSKSIHMDLAVNKFHKLNKPNTISLDKRKKNIDKPKARLEIFDFKHEENDFADQNYDRLIPQRLSKEGPVALAVDFNKDEILDIFLGGARYQESVLMLANGNGGYEKMNIQDFKLDAKYEDVAAATLDFDNDGDLDLYIVSGGNDAEELNKFLEDRLYLNNGNGNFKRLPMSLPHTNGSIVAVSDFDQDGYDDLFVGSRSMPNSYGLSPISFILRNKEGAGVEINQKGRYGMITDASWVDIDQDDDLDLVLCGDWMSISILENHADSFQFRNNIKGLNNSSGLWNSLAFHDFNEDGKLDIIAANAGLNFKWKATHERPVKLFVTDIDQNGLPESIVFHYYFGRYMPFNSYDELVSKLPILKKKFLNYKDFSKVHGIRDLTDTPIIEEKKLDELRSMIYISKDVGYEEMPLHSNAQWSTIQDFYIDQKSASILFVANDHQYLTSLGKSMGNSGGILSNFDIKTSKFKEYASLDLPADLDTRRIVELSNKRYLITCNNDVQYILDLAK